MDNCFSFLVRYPEDLNYAESMRSADVIYRVDTQFAVVGYCGRKVANDDNLPYGNVPKCLGLCDITHLTEMGVPQAESLPGFDLYGRGVMLGLVDSGINYQEDVFQRTDGTNRVKVIWDQTADNGNEEQLENVPFAPFGSVYDSKMIESGEAETEDVIGHGTYLASVAAGRKFGEFRGVAPECELAVVKLRQAAKELKDYWRIDANNPCYSETDIILGVQFLVQFARQKGRPLVLLIALETNSGSHTGAGLFGDYLNRLCQERETAIVIAAGNEGNAEHHYRSRGFEVMDSHQPEEVSFAVNGSRQLTMEFWGEVGDLYSIDIISPGGNRLGKVPVVTEGLLSKTFLLEGTQIVVAYQSPERQTGNELIQIKFRDLTNGIWTLQVYPERVLSGRTNFHLWLPIRTFLQGETTFLRPDPDETITEPGNASMPITIGAYDDLSGGILPESSRGYTRSNRVKPDLVAPGYRIPGNSGQMILGEQEENGMVLRSGTSVAAACAAGVAILMMEWGIVRGNRPYLRGTELKSLLINGAIREERTFPNREWGYGKTNLLGAFQEIR